MAVLELLALEGEEESLLWPADAGHHPLHDVDLGMKLLYPLLLEDAEAAPVVIESTTTVNSMPSLGVSLIFKPLAVTMERFQIYS